jgi:hypothetical protein
VLLHFDDPGQYELRIISMREQKLRSDLARGTLGFEHCVGSGCEGLPVDITTLKQPT